MSDPSQPRALSDAQPAAHAPAASSWTQRGGVRGCFDGRQSLAATFWLLGVGVAAVLMVVGLLLSAGSQAESFGGVLFTTTLLTLITRAAAWYAIVQCRRNTSSPAFTAMALIAVALDMVYGSVKWPSILFATLVS